MKITHIIPALTRGGAEQVVVDLANAASRRGHEVTIVVAHPIEPALHALDAAVNQRTVRPSGPVRSVYPALLPWLFANRGWLFEQDIIHCHLTFGSAAGSIIRTMRRLSRRAKPKVVETSHAVGMPIPAGRRRLLAWLAADRDGYVLMAEDPFWRAFASRHPKLPLRVIPNGTSVNRTVPTRSEREAYRRSIGLPASAGPVVGTIGRLSADRNPMALLDVFLRVAREVSETHFIMGGAGPLLEALVARTSMEGLRSRFHFPGLIVEVPLALSLIDLYVSINVGPITGLAGLEAAASGIPVVALQARNDYLARAEDWIWSSPDIATLAAEAVRLLRAPAKRAELASRQAQHVREHYSSEAAAVAYDAFYRELLA